MAGGRCYFCCIVIEHGSRIYLEKIMRAEKNLPHFENLEQGANFQISQQIIFHDCNTSDPTKPVRTLSIESN